MLTLAGLAGCISIIVTNLEETTAAREVPIQHE